MAGWASVPIFQGTGVPSNPMVENDGLQIGYNSSSRDGWILASSNIPFCKAVYVKMGSYYYIICAVARASYDNSMRVYNTFWIGSYYSPSNGPAPRSFSSSYGDFMYFGPESFDQCIDEKRNPAIPAYETKQDALDALNDGIWEEIPEDTDPYSGIDGEGGIPGGGSVGIPSFPPLSATSTGIVGLFAPSPSQMQALADYMWTDFGGTGTDVTEVLKEIVEALKRAISNPLDYVIGLNIIPSHGLSIGDSSVIKFGFTSSGVSMPRLSNQYFAVNCGSIAFPPLCGDTFLDYAPYSKFSIYLPYIGVKDVDANDFVGHTIGVVYHGDTVTGGVTAYITKDGSVMYQYSGCCALNIPLSADNWGNTISGAVQIATSLVTGAATGGAAGVGMAAAKGAASVAANPSLLSPQVSHSGAVSGGAGCMAVQYPFVIREAVRFHSTAGFNKFSGYPSYYKRSLGAISGFTTVFDVHLENVPATNGEISEIENLLKSGVIL